MCVEWVSEETKIDRKPAFICNIHPEMAALYEWGCRAPSSSSSCCYICETCSCVKLLLYAVVSSSRIFGTHFAIDNQMDVSESDDYDSDELNEAYEEACGNLKDGSVTCLNLDGTFRCPYSPSRKKRTYKYTEILQHAEAVSKGSRGPAMAGKHVALKEYLEKDMAERAPPLVQRQFHMQQDVAPRVDSEALDKRVYPWMGILQNITRNPSESSRIGARAADIKEKLKDFNPESVKVLHDVEGHQVVAVIRFRQSMDGLQDAEAFETSFCCKGWGRSDFEKDYPNECGTHLYGWMATKKDVESSNELLSDHLKANGDLKSLSDIVRDLEARAQQQVQNLKEVLIKKEEALQAAQQENWSLTNKVDHLTRQLEQAKKSTENLETKLENLEISGTSCGWI